MTSASMRKPASGMCALMTRPLSAAFSLRSKSSETLSAYMLSWLGNMPRTMLKMRVDALRWTPAHNIKR